MTAQSLLPKQRANVSSSVVVGSAEFPGCVCSQIRANRSGFSRRRRGDRSSRRPSRHRSAPSLPCSAGGRGKHRSTEQQVVGRGDAKAADFGSAHITQEQELRPGIGAEAELELRRASPAAVEVSHSSSWCSSSSEFVLLLPAVETPAGLEALGANVLAAAGAGLEADPAVVHVAVRAHRAAFRAAAHAAVRAAAGAVRTDLCITALAAGCCRPGHGAATVAAGRCRASFPAAHRRCPRCRFPGSAAPAEKNRSADLADSARRMARRPSAFAEVPVTDMRMRDVGVDRGRIAVKRDHRIWHGHRRSDPNATRSQNDRSTDDPGRSRRWSP